MCGRFICEILEEPRADSPIFLLLNNNNGIDKASFMYNIRQWLFGTILVGDGIGIRVGSGSSSAAQCFIISVRSSSWHLRIYPRLARHHDHLALIFPRLLLALILFVRPTFHTLTEKVRYVYGEFPLRPQFRRLV